MNPVHCIGGKVSQKLVSKGVESSQLRWRASVHDTGFVIFLWQSDACQHI